jgi:hypothetical protein
MLDFIGWGGRVRTSEWRNQNQVVFSFGSKRIPTNEENSLRYISIGYPLRSERQSVICHPSAERAKLDEAVRAAYGMPEDADPLAFLLNLNAKIAADEASGQPIQGPIQRRLTFKGVSESHIEL